jgi:hypothetical protein
MLYCESAEGNGFEAITAVTMSNTAFWYMMPYRLVEDNRDCSLLSSLFLGLYLDPKNGRNIFLRIAGRRRFMVSCFDYTYTLKMERAYSSKRLWNSTGFPSNVQK